MFRTLAKPLAWAGVAVLAASLAFAQVERFDLGKMVAQADNAVHGRIVAKEVVRIDHPEDGLLFFTHMTVEGTSLYDGRTIRVPVTFGGGFISPDEGVYSSEAPSADETRIGNEVVVFYQWSDNMGGGLAANALMAAHAGLYRLASTKDGPVVLGKGDGFAISSNVRLAELRTQIAEKRVK